MNTHKTADIAKRIVEFMFKATDAKKGMLSILESLIKDEELSDQDLVATLAQTVIFMAQMHDRTMHHSISSIAALLALLYPGKSPAELARMATHVLAGKCFEDDA